MTTKTDYVDVLIIGASLSGIGGVRRLVSLGHGSLKDDGLEFK